MAIGCSDAINTVMTNLHNYFSHIYCKKINIFFFLYFSDKTRTDTFSLFCTKITIMVQRFLVF